MKIKLMTGEDKTFMERAMYIIYMYDEITGSITNVNIKIKRMLIIHGENDLGGLLLDYHHREKAPFYRLMFAAFEKHNRRKGYLRACLEFAKNNNINIPLVEFDNFDQIDMWEKFGYSNPTILQGTGWLQVISNVDIKTLY